MTEMERQVTLTLTADQALVFFEWLARGAKDGLPVEDEAERRVFWTMEAQLDKVLVEPFKENYVALVKAARERVIAAPRGS